MTNSLVVYTSYFAKSRCILKSDPDACLVSIAGKTPEWFTGHKMKLFAPHYSWWAEWHEKFKDDLDSIDSVTWYRNKYITTVLDILDPEEVLSQIKSMSGGKPVYLMCYEAPGKFCHRHIVAEWLSNAGVDCREFC